MAAGRYLQCIVLIVWAFPRTAATRCGGVSHAAPLIAADATHSNVVATEALLRHMEARKEALVSGKDAMC